MTREQQVSTTTQQDPQAINADRVRDQRQAVEGQRDHLVNRNFVENADSHANKELLQQLYTVSQTGTEWTHSWWECGGDLKICLCGTFCPCCMICSNARALGKSGLVYNVLACIVPCVPMFLLRQEASRQFGIRSEVGEDLALSWCCTDCVNCQLAAEIKAQEKKQSDTQVIEMESQMMKGEK